MTRFDALDGSSRTRCTVRSIVSFASLDGSYIRNRRPKDCRRVRCDTGHDAYSVSPEGERCVVFDVVLFWISWRFGQIRRAAARRIGTTYAPDFLGLMEVALVSGEEGMVSTRFCRKVSCT